VLIAENALSKEMMAEYRITFFILSNGIKIIPLLFYSRMTQIIHKGIPVFFY